MTDSSQKLVLNLKEYKTENFSPNTIPPIAGEIIWRKYGNQIDIEFPNPKNNNQWQLTSQGWVGYIPLTTELSHH